MEEKQTEVNEALRPEAAENAHTEKQQVEQPQTQTEMAQDAQPEAAQPSDSAARQFSACISGLMFCLVVFLASSYAIQISLQLGLLLWARLFHLEFAAALRQHLLLFSSIPMYCIAFPLTLFLVRWRFPEQRFLRSSADSRPAAVLHIGPLRLFACFAAAYALMLLGNLIGNGLMQVLSNETPNVVEEAVTRSESWEILLFTVICAPFAEELLLRRVLVDRLREFGGGTAVFLSALTFGLMHGNFFQFFYAFFLGALFAYLYLRSGKLWITVLLHMLINFMGGYLPQRLLAIEEPGLYQLANVLLGAFILLLLVVGIVTLIRGLRRLSLAPRELLRPCSPRWLCAVFWNPGMIVFLAGSLLLFWMSS